MISLVNYAAPSRLWSGVELNHPFAHRFGIDCGLDGANGRCDRWARQYLFGHPVNIIGGQRIHVIGEPKGLVTIDAVNLIEHNR